jgi:hypothetical protein
VRTSRASATGGLTSARLHASVSARQGASGRVRVRWRSSAGGLSSRPIRPDEPIAILHHGPDGKMTAPQQGGPPPCPRAGHAASPAPPTSHATIARRRFLPPSERRPKVLLPAAGGWPVRRMAASIGLKRGICDELLALADGSDIAAQGVVRLDFAKGGPQRPPSRSRAARGATTTRAGRSPPSRSAITRSGRSTCDDKEGGWRPGRRHPSDARVSVYGVGQLSA